MKKLTLNKINFVGTTKLTREQLKKVMGGTTPELIGDGNCLQECPVTEVGSACSSDASKICTFYAATTDCPAGQRLCV